MSLIKDRKPKNTKNEIWVFETLKNNPKTQKVELGSRKLKSKTQKLENKEWPFAFFWVFDATKTENPKPKTQKRKLKKWPNARHLFLVRHSAVGTRGGV